MVNSKGNEICTVSSTDQAPFSRYMNMQYVNMFENGQRIVIFHSLRVSCFGIK
jgi:hypothetical protein